MTVITACISKREGREVLTYAVCMNASPNVDNDVAIFLKTDASSFLVSRPRRVSQLLGSEIICETARLNIVLSFNREAADSNKGRYALQGVYNRPPSQTRSCQ